MTKDEPEIKDGVEDTLRQWDHLGSRVWIVVRRMHAPMSNDTIDVPLVTRDYEAAAHYIKTFARPYVSFELIEKGVE